MEKYAREEFPGLMSAKQLTRFVVLSVEPLLLENRVTAKKRGLDRKVRMAEVTVARERDLGVNDEQFVVVSHLGNILGEGDIVQG
jgi:nonsense-mediated mRNA decay protein 3